MISQSVYRNCIAGICRRKGQEWVGLKQSEELGEKELNGGRQDLFWADNDVNGGVVLGL